MNISDRLMEWGAWIREGRHEYGWSSANQVYRIMKYGGVVGGGSVSDLTSASYHAMMREGRTLNKLHEAIEDLDDDSRDLVYETYVYQKMRHELANELGVQKSAITRRLARIRIRLAGDITSSYRDAGPRRVASSV